MNLENLDQKEQVYRYYLGEGKTVEERYPDRYGDITGSTGGYVKPRSDILDTIIWVWLKWHRVHSFIEVRTALRPVINRSTELNSDTRVCQRLREDHDSFLIQLSVISGSKELMISTAESVQQAIENTKEYQFYQAWTGILKYRILEDENNVQKQYEIMQRYKTLKCYLFPTKKEIE